MKSVHLRVNVSYSVGVTMMMPDDVFESLQYMKAAYRDGFNLMQIDQNCDKATDWLEENIKEQDAYGETYTIIELKEVNHG